MSDNQLIKISRVDYVQTEAASRIVNGVVKFELAQDKGRINAYINGCHVSSLFIYGDREKPSKDITIEQVIKDSIDLFVTNNPDLDIEEIKKLKVKNLSSRERLAMALKITNAIRSISPLIQPYYESDIKCVFEIVLNLLGRRD